MCGLTAWEHKIDGVSSFKKGGGRGAIAPRYRRKDLQVHAFQNYYNI